VTIVEQIAANRRRTVFLFFGFFLLYAMIGYAAALFWGDIAMLAVGLVAIVIVLAALFGGDDLAVSLARGKRVESRDQAPELWDAVETAAIAAGIKMPRVFISPDPEPNAFAAGRNEDQALVCANVGLLRALDKQEVEGVMAHEIAHIQNRDVRLMTYVAVLAGSIALLSFFISRMFIFGGSNRNSGGGNIILIVVALIAILLAPLAATIIQMAISRRREFLADAQAADLTRYPQGLASALETISGEAPKRKEEDRGKAATAHMYISPLALEKKGIRGKMFSTHPPTEERVARLLELAGGVRHQHKPNHSHADSLAANDSAPEPKDAASNILA